MTEVQPSPSETPAAPSLGLQAGMRLGEWVLEAPLGRGGYAEVWSARHNALPERRAALKVPFDPAFAAGLRREGVLQHGVEGEHVVRVLGLDPDHDPPYLVVDLIEGGSLRARLEAAGGPLPPAEVARILREVCLGLRAAHARGVVHRDLKPENVLLDADGRAHVADFGLGLLTAQVTAELLTSGSLRTGGGQDLVGTLRYMAPEQRDPEGTVDARADLYALGVILFELLTGEAPCGGEVPSDVVPGLDPRWDALFKRLCARLPARAPDVDAVLADLDAIAAADTGPPPDPAATAAARCVDVPAGLVWRGAAFALDALPFLILAWGPLRIARGVSGLFLVVGLLAAYDIVATALFGRTLGKLLMGLRVADARGRRPELTQGLLRASLRLVSLAALGLGYLPAVIPGRRALHDALADTEVLHD